MRIVNLGELPERQVNAFDSHGFFVSRLSPDAHVVYAELRASGTIGRHDAVVDQLLVVLSGRCCVSGADGVQHEIGVGSAALWLAGESHETNALGAATALVVEAKDLATNFD